MVSAVKRSCLMLIMMCLGMYVQAQQTVLEKQYTFDFSEADLDQALKIIEEEADVRFSYIGRDLRSGSLGMRFQNMPLFHIFQKILTPYNLSYIYVGQNSFVIRREHVAFDFTYQVSGFVRDNESGQPLAHVLVSGPGEDARTTTNDSGFFNIRLNRSPQFLVFSYQGFHSVVKIADQSSSYYHRVMMERNILREIVKRSRDTLTLSIRSSGYNLNFGVLENTPSLHTSPGVLNSVKFIAGFQSALDANGGISVRGGGVDENLVLYDGVLIYNPMHLPGWFSVFSKRSVEKAELVKSGISASHGGRVSSVIDTKSRAGNMRKYKAGLSVSPLASEAYLEGPLIRDKLSFVVSARRTFTDLWSPLVEELLTDNGLESINIYLYDINAGIDWATGPKSKMQVRFYTGGDRGYLNERLRTSERLEIREDNRQSYLWRNMMGSVEFVKSVTNNLNIRNLTYFTSYGFNLKNSYQIEISNASSSFTKFSDLQYRNEVMDIGNQFQVNRKWSDHHKIQAGAEVILHRFTPPTTEYLNLINGEVQDEFKASVDRINASEVGSFVSYSYSRRKLMISAGMRYSWFKSDSSYHILQPRLQINWYPRPPLKFYAHYDRLNQTIIAVNSSESGLQYTVWVPVSAGMRPVQVDQFSLGASRQFFGQTQLIVEGYYKAYTNVYDYYNSRIDFLKNWQAQLSEGTGYSRGVEMTFKSGGSKWVGWVSYTYSKSMRKFDEINNGAYYPFQFNRTHDFSVFYNRQLKNGWVIGGSWIYASGNYITIPESRYILEFEGEILIAETFGPRNNYRLPAYHRLDVGLSKTYHRNKFDHRFSLSVYNAYFSQNPYYVTLSFNEKGVPVINQVSLLPLMPIFQYAIEFK